MAQRLLSLARHLAPDESTRTNAMAPSYTLWGCDNTASTGVHWLLLQLAETQGAKFEYKRIDIFEKKEQKGPEYLKLNPKGRVPTLVVHAPEGGVAVTESGAIVLTLIADFPALGPKGSLREKAKWNETFIYIVNSLLPALRDWMYASKDGKEEYAHGVRLLTLDRLKMMYGFLDKHLADRKFLGGDEVSAIDFLFDATLSWDGFTYMFARKYPNIKRYDDEMRSLESFKVLKEEEGIEISGIKDWEEPYLKLL